MNKVMITLFLAGAVCLSAWSEEEEISLTVYNQDFAFVRTIRDLELEEGISSINFKDVASTIDRTSVHFRSLTDPEGTVILEQNYEYDLVSSSKIFQKYLGKKISVMTEEGETYEGTLGSYDGGQLVLLDAVREIGDKIPVAMVRQDQLIDVRFPELPEGLITTPSLQWLLHVDQGGTHRAEVSYIAGSVNWSADYNAVLSAADDQIDLTGWVTVDNRSGTAYKDAKLKLLAGDVRRIEEERVKGRGMMMEAARADFARPQVEQKEFFEYHLYTVQRPTTIKDRQTKQIEFTRSMDVPVEKKFVMESDNPWGNPTREEVKIDVQIELRNDQESGLGIPLPKGKVRVFKRDSDGSMEFVGEDRIDHTPKDEDISLQIGKAFDIVGERTQTDFQDSNAFYTESYHIAVRNHKKESVRVHVKEHFNRWNEWTLYTDAQYKKLDTRTVQFPLDIPRDATGEIEYTVRYEKRR